MHKIFIILFITTLSVYGQEILLEETRLDLLEAVEISKENSPIAFGVKQQYEIEFWDYKSFKADLLPQVSFNAEPFSFNRFISRQFNPNQSTFDYFEQSNLDSEVSLSIDQQLPFTGGRFFIQSDFSRLENFGDNESISFSSAPIIFGFTQPLFRFNILKWNKIDRKQQFENLKKDYIYEMENNTIETVDLYFELLEQQLNLDIFKTNFDNAKRLFEIGKKRFELTTLSKSDILLLEIEKIKNRDKLFKAKLSYDVAMKRLVNHLGIYANTKLCLEIPVALLPDYIKPEEALAYAEENNPRYFEFERKRNEANMQIKRAKKDNGIQANIRASIGLNQQTEDFNDFYNDLLDQERVNVSINIPILSWSKRKSEVMKAIHRKELVINVNTIERNALNQRIITNVESFNYQKTILNSSKFNSDSSQEVYEINSKRFLLGKLDVNNLIISQNRKDNAQREYYEALKQYFKLYYTIQRMTLYNFKENKSMYEFYK